MAAPPARAYAFAMPSAPSKGASPESAAPAGTFARYSTVKPLAHTRFVPLAAATSVGSTSLAKGARSAEESYTEPNRAPL